MATFLFLAIENNVKIMHEMFFYLNCGIVKFENKVFIMAMRVILFFDFCEIIMM